MRCRDAVLVLVLLAGVARADDRLDKLAAYHYKAGEYYRAITDYEELALFAPDEASRTQALIRIATSYHRAHQLVDAVAAYRVALDATHDPELAQALRIQLALARAERTLDEPGADALDVVAGELAPATAAGAHRELALYHLARIHALRGHDDEARTADAALVTTCVRPSAACKLEPILARAIARPAAPHRSRLLGVALSAVVPGAGSVYGGHLVDGLYYFGLTTLTGLGAWDVHDPSRRWTDQKATFYGLTALAGMFYAANLLQGYVSVERFNAVAEHDARHALWTETELGLPLE